MYAFGESAVVEGEVGRIWAVAVDVPRWPEWDPHEEQARFDGPFVAGATGWVKPKGAPAGPFTVTAVDPGRSWTSEAGIPFGKLRGTRTYEQLDPEHVRVSERIEVHGAFAPIFRLIWVKGMARDLPLTLAALGREATRRADAGE